MERLRRQPAIHTFHIHHSDGKPCDPAHQHVVPAVSHAYTSSGAQFLYDLFLGILLMSEKTLIATLRG
mgnify:CR=1 FL=1